MRYVQYRCHDCLDCPLRERCTKSQSGRTIKRYESDELSDAMKQVLDHPKALEAYKQRLPLAEGIYAELRGQQGLTRFHRSGLKKVRVEFSLHCIAFNVRRYLGATPGLLLRASITASDGSEPPLCAWITVWVPFPAPTC